MLLSSASQSSFPSTPAYNQYLQPYTPILFSDNLSLKAIALPFLRPLNASNTTLRHVSGTIPHDEPPDAADTGGCEMVSSASAVSAAIRRASTSPVEFTQRIENDSKQQLVLPSPDFQRLCLEQLGLFRRIVDSDAVLSVFVRPAGSYVMDRLELRRVSAYPAVNATDIVVLVGTFRIPTGLRSAEAALSSQQVEVVAQQRALVFPMVKEPFVVGFLVAEVSDMDMAAENRECDEQNDVKCPSPQTDYALRPRLDAKSWEVQSPESELWRLNVLTAEQRSNAIYIARSLAVAYVMDQKAMLSQQSSWQNNVRMSALVEQIRGPLSSVRTLTKMLSTHVKRNEISYDIVEDILVQSDRMRDTLQELQDAVYLTKANVVRYNKETLRKLNKSAYSHPKSMRSQLLEDTSSDKLKSSGELLSLSSAAEDLELPMPPHALAPLQQQGIRPCNVSDVLSNLVDAMRPLAHKQRRLVEFSNLSLNLQVAIEEPALRQALSNLIEGALLRTQVGGKVEIVSTGAPAGGTLVVIDDDGPDMHFMTQMHSLTPFGPELLSEGRIEDNMTWNFVASLTVAREILESYGCVVRVISPRSSDAALGAGGTRVELWLPAFAALSDSESNGLTCDA